LATDQITVVKRWSSRKLYDATTGQGEDDDSAATKFALEVPGMHEMVDIAALNSKIKFDCTDAPFTKCEILGDATETGLALFAG
jgi:sodium/potassium-transporting ATPase subunit alpha